MFELLDKTITELNEILTEEANKDASSNKAETLSTAITYLEDHKRMIQNNIAYLKNEIVKCNFAMQEAEQMRSIYGRNQKYGNA